MHLLQSLHDKPNIAIVGASGGIGRALVSLLADSGRSGRLYALSRSPIDLHHGGIVRHAIDISDEDSIRQAAAASTERAPLDLVIVATGILHDKEGLRPEKSLKELEPQQLARVFAVNAIGPALVAKHFLPRLRSGHKTVFAALSARVGSIGDNRLGGWASYRASKAALNMLLRTVSIEHARRFPLSIVAGLHPGTVDTPLSQPFSANVPDGRLFTPALAAERLLAVIDDLRPEDSGRVYAWDGEPIPW